MRVSSFGAVIASAAMLWLSACASGGGSAPQKDLSTSEPPTSSVVRIAVSAEPYPPFSFRDASGNWSGFDMDLARAVCEAKQLTCEFVGVPWKDLIQTLMAGRVDAIWSSMQVTEERRKVINFTNIYYESLNALIGRAGDTAVPNIVDPGSLAGKIVGVQEATASAAFLHNRFGATAEVKPYSRLDNALADLRAGRLDYVSEFVAFLVPFLDANPGFAIKTIWPLDPILNQGVAVAIRRDDTALRDKLNDGIATVIRNGAYDRVLDRYTGLGREIRKPQL